MRQRIIVVPYVGTWIEMGTSNDIGLKFGVVPYVGTWIEISAMKGRTRISLCRSLRGNVDRNAASCPSWSPATSSFPTWERG